MKMRSFCVSALIVLVLVAGLVGCKNSNTSKAATITFWVMPNGDPAVQDKWFGAKAEEFKAKTGITVKVETVGWSDAFTRISTSVATGEGADVFQVGTTWNGTFAAADGLLEVDLNEFDGASAYMKASLDSAIYKNKCYGLPWFAETRALFYNKEMFEGAGVEPPKTYDELVTVGKKIVAKYGTGTAISVAGTNAWDLQHNWAVLLYSRGQKLISDDNKKAIFNSEDGIKSMDWYISLFELGLASKSCSEFNQPQSNDYFKAGKAAMIITEPSQVQSIKTQYPDLRFGVVEPPQGPKGTASFAGGSNLAILKGSKNIDAAKEWVKFLMEKSQQVGYCKDVTGFLPAKIEAYDDPFFSNDENMQVFKKTLGYATAYPTLGVWGDIEVAVRSGFANIITAWVSGKYNTDTVKKELDKQAAVVDSKLKLEE